MPSCRARFGAAAADWGWKRETGAPETIRTSDLCLRRATLYPAELRAPCRSSIDETGGSGNGLEFARLECAGGSCGKGRTFESSRARQWTCVPRACRGCLTVAHDTEARIGVVFGHALIKPK